MMELDEILFNAITSDDVLMEAVGRRVKDVCFPVSPGMDDNVPLPSIVVTDQGSQQQPDTKDCEWEPSVEHVQASVEVSAESPRAVRELVRHVMRAVGAYVGSLSDADVPQLDAVRRDGVAWDWTKPCYYDTVRYECTLYK